MNLLRWQKRTKDNLNIKTDFFLRIIKSAINLAVHCKD